MTNKTVRPIMTVEARDAIDNMHEICECETRSESIVKYHMLNYSVCKRNVEMSKGLKQWKLIAWSMTAACIALIATMMITAS
jgi:hypothetical protein